MAGKRKKIGLLASGSGSNVQAIIDEVNGEKLNVEIAVVISNKADARVLVRAQEAGIKARFIDLAKYPDSKAYNCAILAELVDCGVDLVVMAGYMPKLGEAVLQHYPNAVINLHPALLPAFIGSPHAIEDAFNYGVKTTGVSVHFAYPEYDTGPVIVQRPVAVDEDDTLETLTEKIHAVEHQLLPYAIRLIIEGRVSIKGRKVRINHSLEIIK